MVVGRTRDHDPARFGQPFEPGGDVHPVAVEIAVGLVDDVAEVDADPEAEALGVRDLPLPLHHATLDADGALDGLDGAGELAQRAVAHQLDDAAAVLGQEWLDQLPVVRLEALERASLVALHQARVTGHVGGEDGGEPALRSGRGHDNPPGGVYPPFAPGRPLPRPVVQPTGRTIDTGV